MAKHSFAYGVFTVGRYKSGPSIHKLYVKDAKGQFVGGTLRKQVFRDVFRPRRMWRVTVGHDWVVHGEYTCTKIQAWDTSKIRLRTRMKLEGWAGQVREHSAGTIRRDHAGYGKYVKEKGGWKATATPWFDWTVDVGWDSVPYDRRLIGKVEGPRSERL